MIVVGLILIIPAIAFLCWLLFTLAVYALPLYVGVSVMFALWHDGTSLLAAMASGVAAGILTLIVARLLFASVRTPLMRGAVAALFAAPAVFAGYSATLGLAHLFVAPGLWSGSVAVIGGGLVGVTAFLRLSGGTQIAAPPASFIESPRSIA